MLALVDAGESLPMSGKVLAAVQKISHPNTASRLEGKIRFIVNTNADPDHTGANEILSKAGIGYVTNDPANRLSSFGGDPAILIAHEKVADRLLSPPGGGTPSPIAAVPQNIYTGAGEAVKDLFFDDEESTDHPPHRPLTPTATGIDVFPAKATWFVPVTCT